MTKHFFPRILTIDGLILEYFLVNSRQKKTIFLYFILIPCTSQDSLFFSHHYPLKTIFLCEMILVKLCLLINKQWQRSIHFSYMVGSGYEISKGLHHYLVAKLRVRHAKTNISLLFFTFCAFTTKKAWPADTSVRIIFFNKNIFSFVLYLYLLI